MNRINFFTEDTPFQPKNKSSIRIWINEIVVREKHQLESLNYIFCSDEHLWKMNKEYLNHDTFTDIITFDNSTQEGIIEGDIFISVDRIRDNIKGQAITFLDELHRVIVHGVLHLMGHGDKAVEEKRAMREKEDACLSLLKI